MGYPGRQERLFEEVVASTTTITVSSDLILVSGSTAIATINPPIHGAGGVLYIVPTDHTVATVTTGNIALALTMPQNQVTVLVYSVTNAKWYPGAIS